MKTEEKSLAFYRKYMGGSCIGAYYLLNELKPGIDPFSKENLLIFSTSMISGVKCPGTAMHTVISKSPLTETIGESVTPGYFAEMIKKAGYDAIVIEGKSNEPVYIYINNENVEYRSAKNIWGKRTNDAYDCIKSEMEESEVSISLIGPAGENLVRFASIVSDLIFNSSRCGLGAVMGSKNLKAIAVYGNREIEVYNEKKLDQLSRYFKENFMKNPVNALQYNNGGSGGFLNEMSKQGILSTKNFKTASFKNSKHIDGGAIANKYKYKNINCSNCFGGCKRVLKGIDKNKFDKRFGAPELETIASIPYNLQISDTLSVIEIQQQISSLGLDGTSCGTTLGFIFECFEKKLIDINETGGLRLEWGNSEVVIELINQIAYRKGIGDLLAEGVKRASNKIDGSKSFTLHIKGLEMPMHEPRVKQMLGFGYAIGETGPIYTIVEHDTDFDFNAPELFLKKVSPLTIYDRAAAAELSNKKIRNFFLLKQAFSMLDALDACIFAFSPVRFFDFKHLVEIINAVTGWETSLFELLKLGEKRAAMFRIFSKRESIDEKYDMIPNRLYEPIENGVTRGLKIKEEDFKKAKKLYYKMAGYNKKGFPTYEKLLELGIDNYF